MSFVHSSHPVRQLGGKLTHQSKLYVSDLTNLFDTFTHDTPQICTTHRVDPALKLVHFFFFFENLAILSNDHEVAEARYTLIVNSSEKLTK